MFGAFRTFGRMGAAAGRTIAQQIAAMSPSLWLEPSVTNGYQDSAGTTALTQPGAGSADPPVGLALDLSQGLVRGSNIYTRTPTMGAGWSISGSSLVATSANYTTAYIDNVPLVVGKTYEWSFTVSSVSGAGQLQFALGAPTNYVLNKTPTVDCTYSGRSLVASGTSAIFRGVDNLTCQISNISVRELKGSHALQSTSTARPKLSARVNLLVGTATLSTQSVTVTAAAHTIDWSGAGTITASGAHSGALSKGQTFTPSAGTLTLTVSGSVTSASLVLGSSVGTYQAVTDANNYAYAGWPLIHQFDGVDDVLNVTFPSSLGSDCTVVTANRGTTPTIATGQTIGTSYTITATNAGRLVFPRALTAAETAIVTAWATKKGALPA